MCGSPVSGSMKSRISIEACYRFRRPLPTESDSIQRSRMRTQTNKVLSAVPRALSHRPGRRTADRTSWTEPQCCHRYGDSSPVVRSGEVDLGLAGWPDEGARTRCGRSRRVVVARVEQAGDGLGRTGRDGDGPGATHPNQHQAGRGRGGEGGGGEGAAREGGGGGGGGGGGWGGGGGHAPLLAYGTAVDVDAGQ